jgi:hypothetical protein
LERIVIKLRDDIVFEDPQSRVREYCEIEVYSGYDDRHSINDQISKEDINAANNLYAMIDRYDSSESKRLLNRSRIISNLLSTIPNKDIFDVSNEKWLDLREEIRKLLAEILSVQGIGLAKATKILHLKRPNLFPVLDSLVIKLLLHINISDVEKSHQLAVGLQALEKAREIMTVQKAEFEKLVDQTYDLPIPLTAVRIFDILCWTTEKWDIQGILHAPYGVPRRSLLTSLKQKEDPMPDVEKMKDHNKYVVFEDLERATGPKVHHVDCFYYKRWLSNPTTTTTWHGPYESEEKAWKVCKTLSLRSGFKPSKHNCIRHARVL